MKAVIGKVFSVLLNILLVIVILILILLGYNYFQSKIMKKDYTNYFGYSAFKVVSGSMADTINIGDIVITKIKKENEEFRENDIIVFRQDNSIITHRIVEIEGENILTKGDANNTTDDVITKDKIIGKVIKIIPNLEIWKQVFTSPEVFISGITTIILFTIAFSYNGNKKNNQDKQKSTEEQKEDKNNVK